MQHSAISITLVGVVALFAVIVTAEYSPTSTGNNNGNINGNINAVAAAANNNNNDDDITVLASPSLPATADDLDYYGVVLANLLNNRQAILEEKRSCIRRGGPCDHRPNDCCPKSSCRCNLWGTNCRCHRLGLFQKSYSSWHSRTNQ